MISVIIPTLNDAARLPQTLSSLVDGVADGLIKQVVFADAGSTDDTLAIAEATGCDIAQSDNHPGRQLKAGVAATKAKWLLFLDPGTELDKAYLDETRRFLSDGDGRAAAFRYARADSGAQRDVLIARGRELLKRPTREQGLLISRALFEKVGGIAASDWHGEMIRRLGASRLVILKTNAYVSPR